MTNDLYVIAIVVLLPITAAMVITQTNPYHALVMRGILGSVAALVYALFGAADVALTEALVGTMLSITLYAIAVRSSMSLRLGIVEGNAANLSPEQETIHQEILTAISKSLSPHHMRLEQVPYPTPQALQAALQAKDIHATYLRSESETQPAYQIQTRVKRLYTLMQGTLPPESVHLSYAPLSTIEPLPRAATAPPQPADSLEV